MSRSLKIVGILLLGFVPASDTIPRQLPPRVPLCNGQGWDHTGRVLVKCRRDASSTSNGQPVCKSHRTSLIGAS